MKEYMITYDNGYSYNYYRTYANNKTEARRDFRNGMGSRYKIIEIEEI